MFKSFKFFNNVLFTVKSNTETDVHNNGWRSVAHIRVENDRLTGRWSFGDHDGCVCLCDMLEKKQ